MAAAWYEPDWPLPPGVRAAVTTRCGGESRPPYEQFNLATHVGDDPARVARNRERLVAELQLPSAPAWLSQVHGTRVVRLGAGAAEGVEADGCWTDERGVACAVLTADCLPVLLCDPRGGRVAAVHAGWRGLAAGVLEAAAAEAGADGDWLAWLGPAIGPAHFQVGPEVCDAFVDRDPGAAVAFAPGPQGRAYGDLFELARRALGRVGVTRVSGGGICTFRERSRYYSFRRDGATGRFASLIWRT